MGGEATLHLRGRFAIHKNRSVGVCAENGGGASRSDRIVECPPDNIRLARSNHRKHQLRNAKQRRHSDSDGGFWNFIDAFEPAFSRLLPPAGLVEVNDLHVQRIIKISLARIVERQMPIFPDAQQTKLRIGGAELFRIIAACLFRIRSQAIDVSERSASAPFSPVSLPDTPETKPDDREAVQCSHPCESHQPVSTANQGSK